MKILKHSWGGRMKFGGSDVRRLAFSSAVAIALLVSLPSARAGLTNCVINIPALDAGNYDVFGEHDSMEQLPLTGSYSSYPRARNPRRSWLAFRIPDFPGTLTNAVLYGYIYAFGNSTQMLQLRHVATPIEALRRGGFGLTDIYADLADGTIYGSATYPNGASVYMLPLNANFLSDVEAARGMDLAMGGSIPAINPAAADEAVNLSYISLQLQLSAPQEPIIYAQPTRDSSLSNSTSITVGACGATPLTYRWFYGTNSGGVQGFPNFYVPNFSTNPQPVFVVVSNAFGTATSSVVQVKLDAENFYLNFTNRVVRVDDVVDFYLQSFGFYPNNVIWLKNGVPNGRTSFYWQLPFAQTDDTGDYQAVLSGSFGTITSAVAHLDVVETPPIIWQSPISMTIVAGGSMFQTVSAVGGPRPVIRWFRNGALMATQNMSGLYINFVVPSDAGNYYFTASNRLGMVTSEVAVITVITTPPTFTLQPTDQTVYYGGATQFRAAASGIPAPFLRWFHNGVHSPNFFSTYFINSAVAADAGSYYCVASNISGVVTSQVATLTLISVPPILSGPPDTMTTAGYGLSWAIGLSNPPAFLTLVFDETTIVISNQFANSTVASLMLQNLTTNQSGQYFVLASNQFGVSTSRVATLTVTGAPPVFTLSPSNETVLEGTTTFIYFDVYGAPPPEFALYHNGVAVASHATVGLSFSPSGFAYIYTLPYVTMADGGDYFVVASNSFGVTTSVVVHISVQRAGPLDRWTLRNPIPQGRDLHRVAWGQNQFVAVGDNGAVVTSPDGTNWTARNTHTAENLSSIAYGNGRFVAVGKTGTGVVLTSTNGEAWNSAIVLTNTGFYDITFANRDFLAVGYNSFPGIPSAFRSTNGTDWTAVDMSPDCCYGSYFSTATFGAGFFVVTDANGEGYVSPDLVSWFRATSGANIIALQPLGSAFVNDGFVVVANNGYLNGSANGYEWGPRIYNQVTSRNLYGVAHGAGRYIVVGSKGSIITSTGDLQSWSAVASPTTDRLEDVIFANNLFVAVGENGTILTSSSGLTWSGQTRGVNYDVDGLAVGNGLAVAVGKGGTILTSSDGTTWNYHLAPGVPDLHGVAYGNGQWVAVGDSTNIFTSTDGLNWLAHSPGFEFSYLKSVLYANGLWVAVGIFGQIITSPDAVTWTMGLSPTSYDLNEVTYGSGLFVVVGDRWDNPNETILTSPDGINWTDQTFFGGKNGRGIAFANGTYVIAANDGNILYTSYGPGTTNTCCFGDWHLAYTGITGSGTGSNLRGVTWSNNLWVVVGNNGRILTSTNVYAWRQRVSPTFENLHAVRYINNTFIAIGNEGVILQSQPLVPKIFAERNGNQVRLVFSSPHEGIFKLQSTDDFTWQDLAFITNVLGSVDYIVPLPAGSGHSYFRVVAP